MKTGKKIKKKYISPKVSSLEKEVARAKIACEEGGPSFFHCLGGGGSPSCSDPSMLIE